MGVERARRALFKFKIFNYSSNGRIMLSDVFFIARAERRDEAMERIYFVLCAITGSLI